MNKFTSNEIRLKWIEFFKEKDHYYLSSASLIPVNDKSLLWINSGVATLKGYFDGSEQPPSKRLVNSQKVIRTSDINNVGITSSHHTFFEMLGNFSIGDYFKKESIKYAWELLTSSKWLDIDKNLLYVTVFEDDIEGYEIWKQIIPENKIFKMKKETNFWDMGKGPCGPCTEIFYDKGKKYDIRSAKELIKYDIDNDRYVEIWNIVFSEFNNDGKNNYKELPQKNIDTGAGLERLTSILQEKPSNFETDLFIDIIKTIDFYSEYQYQYEYISSELKTKDKKQFYINSYYKKIADYIRSVSFAIADGALPEATGRGYIIRMLLRKAVIYRTKLGIRENILHELVAPLVKIMSNQYPELIKKKDIIIKIIKIEEDQFNKTLLIVLKKLKEEIKNKTLNEKSAYKLHETYGLPLEYIKDISLNNDNINLDWEKIKQLDLKFKNKSKAKHNIDAMNIQDDIFIGLGETNFLGYNKSFSVSKVLFINNDYVVFDKTPFYATSGGQESDFGFANEYKVVYVKKNSEKTFIHLIPNHTFEINDEVSLSINLQRRNGLKIHHSATHLLFSAMEKYFGLAIPQQGSKVEENFLRFDFSFQEKISNNMILEIQKITNKWIDDATIVETKIISIEEAKKIGASYLEGTKYGSFVRVVKENDFCIDMCGGTHVNNTSEIEEILITKFEKRGSGIWRIEAIAGKENISKEIIKINEKIEKEILESYLNKVILINKKIKEINICNELNFSKEISKLDITSSTYKSEVNILNQKIQKEINLINDKLNNKISRVLKIELINNKINIFKYTNFNIQEITKLLLNIINSTNSDMSMIIIEKEQKITCGFIINSKNVSEQNINRIKQFAEKNNLKGNGKNQLYIFGGKKLNNMESLNEVIKWEF